jgi:uncharacterized iron-regulated protein
MLRVMTLLAISGLALNGEDTRTAIGEQHYRIYHGDGRLATLDEVITASAAATVTFLGESHDDPVAHYIEEQILRRVYKPDLALSLEMFETDVQYVLDEYLAGLITESHFIASARAWKNYKSDYRPLIEFAKERKTPVIAANAPRRYVNLVSRLGVAALQDISTETRRFLPPLPYADASLEYAEKVHRVMEGARKEHEKKAGEDASKQPPRTDPVKGLQAQSLWDASMAFSMATYLTRNPTMRLLHVNGSFHSAQRLGIPEHLARYRPGTSMLVITIVSEKGFPEFDSDKMSGQGDFVIVTDPALPRSFVSEPPK